jgi:phosphoserine phosphatase
MLDDRNLLMVTVSGPKQPGVTATLTQVLMAHSAEVVDIEQVSLQNMLGLYFLLDLSRTTHSEDSVVKDLLFEASQLNLKLDFQPFSPRDSQPIGHPDFYVLTHFGDTRALAELSKILSEENVNIETITTLDHHGARSTELIINVNQALNIARLRERIMNKSRELGVDLALQKMEAYRKNKRLIFFDMDSTLVDMEIIDEMASRRGVHREVARITEKAMRGDYDFKESLIQRVALLKDLSIAELTEIRDRIRLSEGVEELITTLRWLGYKMGLVTGGFDFFSNHIKEKLGLDFSYANQLETRKDALTGRVVGPIIDAAEKARLVNQTACDLAILLDQTVVVGDGANDALMLGQAGLGIAYNAKKRLDRVANVSLGRDRLTHIFHLLGITEENISEAMSCEPSQP